MLKQITLVLLTALSIPLFAGGGVDIKCPCGVTGKLYFGAGQTPGTHLGGFCYSCKDFVGYWRKSPDKNALGPVYINSTTTRKLFKCPTCRKPVAAMTRYDVEKFSCPVCASDSAKIYPFKWD